MLSLAVHKVESSTELDEKHTSKEFKYYYYYSLKQAAVIT